MFKFMILLLALVALSMAQQEQYHQNSQNAAIISEQRYLSGDGKFGAAYTQEDGINFKEETDSDGTRHGSYSYVDPSGQRRTISYTAGKNGFQASGDHLPVAPAAPPQPIPQQQHQQQPRYQPQPAAPQHHQQNYNNGNYDNNDGQYDPRYNDPSFSQNQQSYQPAPQQQQQFHHQPAPQQQQQFQHQPAAPTFNHNFQHQQAPQHEYTTQNPHRFQPPGKLSLNRTPDGFSYSFNKV